MCFKTVENITCLAWACVICDVSYPLLLKNKKDRQLSCRHVNKSWKIQIPTNHLSKLFPEWLSLFLQVGAIFVSTKWSKIISNRDSYYKSGLFLQIGAQRRSLHETYTHSNPDDYLKQTFKCSKLSLKSLDLYRICQKSTLKINGKVNRKRSDILAINFEHTHQITLTYDFGFPNVTADMLDIMFRVC